MKPEKQPENILEQKEEIDSIIDLEIRDDEDLDLDSQNSQVKEILNNTSAGRNGGCVTKSYVSNTQFSQFSKFS